MDLTLAPVMGGGEEFGHYPAVVGLRLQSEGSYPEGTRATNTLEGRE